MLTNGQLITVWSFTVLSICIVLFPIVYNVIEGRYQLKVYKEKKAKPFGRQLLIYSFCIISSLICLRMATGFAMIYREAAGAPAATFDNIYESAIFAFQSFNAESTQLNVAILAEALVSGAWWVARILLVFSYLLRIAAPVASGAIFLEVLTEIFPSFKQELSIFRRHYYFSELNERSLALASSWIKEVIASDAAELKELRKRIGEMKFGEWMRCYARALVYKWCKPLVIFTDAYYDNESEKSTELYLKAKSMGAICLRRDISDVRPKRLIFKRHFFLIDDNEIDNIRTLASLTDERYMSALKGAEVYIFYQNDSYVLTERNIIESLIDQYKEHYKGAYTRAYKALCRKQAADDIADAYDALSASVKEAGIEQISQQDIEEQVRRSWRKKAEKALGSNEATDKEKDEKAHELRYKKLSMDAVDTLLPRVTRVRCYQNLIFQLLEDIPLYIPLTNKIRENNSLGEYNITILGNGETGSQMLRAASWCGQLHGYIPCINVFASESFEAVRDQINSKCPELLESARQDSDCLRIFGDKDLNEYSPIYCRIRCAEGDIEKIPLSEISFRDFNDESNLHSITDSDYYLVALGSDELNIQIAEQLGTMLRARQAQGKRKNDKIVIVLAIYDTNLRKMFNLKNGERSSFIRSQEGGVLVEAFGSLEQAYSRSNITMIKHQRLSKGFDEAYRRESEKQGKERMRQRYARTYESWSGIARSVHRKYRMFSALTYMRDNSMWKERDKEKWNDFTDMDMDYFNTVYITSSERSDKFAKDKSGSAEKPSVSERLNVEAYLGWLEHRRWNAYLRSEGFTCRSDGGAKNIELRIHPCLVECKMEPADKCYVGERSALAQKKDLLDEVADNHYKGKVKSYDLPCDADKDFIARCLGDKSPEIRKTAVHKSYLDFAVRYAAELDDYRQRRENEEESEDKG